MDYINQLLSELNRLAENFTSAVEQLASEIFSTVVEGNTLFIAGNGGSASTSQHFAIDLLSISNLSKYPRLSIFDLTSNSAVLTAVGNDIGFEDLYSKQIERFGKCGDLLVTFSASGNSPNILKVVEKAQSLKLRTFGVVGFSGDSLSQKADKVFHCSLNTRNYGIAEDIHLSFSHAVTESFREKIRGTYK